MAEWKIDITKAVEEIIEKLHAEGYTPIKHGKWERGKCTNCEKSLEDLFSGDFYWNDDDLHFCPNCGARMGAADIQPAPQWISVEERLPEIGRSVLIYYPKWDGDEIQVAKLEDDGMMFDICGVTSIMTGKRSVTHWMPLPEPPKDGDAE